MDWPIVIILAVAGLVVAVLFLGAWWLWWRLPKRQVDRLRLTIRDPKARADVEDNFRKSVGQILVGIGAVLIGSAFTYLQFFQQQRQSSLQAQAAHETLMSNEVANGFERLSSDKILVRIGGVYTLAGVINTSDRYYQPLLEALSAFVRDRTRTEEGDGPPATDVQAALTVIGRRAATGTGSPDLSNAHIPRGNLRHANLDHADLTGADLRYAELGGANLSDARLAGANLSDAYLGVMRITHALPFGQQLQFTVNVNVEDQVNLSHADLFNANLSRANLGQADLSDTILSATNLTGARVEWANLRNAKLFKADLTGALLNGAKFDGADLTGAKLDGANLIKATISQTQLDKACGKDVTLDPGLTIKLCP